MGLPELLGTVDDDGDLLVDRSWINSWGALYGGVTVAGLLDRWAGDRPEGFSLAAAHLAFGQRADPAEPLTISSAVAQGGRAVHRLSGTVAQSGRSIVDGFAVAVRSSGPTTAPEPLDPAIPPPDALDEPVGDHRTADVIRHHFELRPVPRIRLGEPVVRQWVRLRHLPPDGDGRLPIAALGLLADLVSIGVFRTAARQLEGVPAVTSLDLGLHLNGSEPSEWSLLTLSTPPIRSGTAVAHANLRDVDGNPVATVTQAVLVRPLAAT